MSKKPSAKELMRMEYKKCAVNPVYFLKNYFMIQHMNRGRMKFNLYPYQEDAINAFKDEKRVITLKARQLGFSTAVAGYSAWLALFHRDKNIVIIATKQETAKNIVTKVRFGYDNLPRWMMSGVQENNKLNIRLDNGSQVKAVSSASDAGRSEAVSLLILDEAAFIENADEIWTSAQPTMATGGSAIVISTPNGMGGFFHKTWEGALSGENDFHPIKLTWRVHPDRDEEWYKNERKVMDDREFSQEYEAEFIGSGNTVYDDYIIQERKEQHEQDPAQKIGFDGNLWVWKEPNYTRPYMVVADVARGDGEDYSAFHVIDSEACEQVAEYKGKLDTEDYGHMLVEIATKYNDALLVIENANHGWATIQTVINRQYKNLFYMNEDILVVDGDKHLTNKWNRRKKKEVPGFTMSSKNRPLLINKLGEYLRDDSVIIRSTRTYSEMFTFVWKNGKAEAQKGYNDDLITSMAIALWVRDTSLKVYELNQQLTKKSLSSIKKRQAVYTPKTTPHGNPYNIPNPNARAQGNPYMNDSDIDTSWLLG